MIKDAIEAFSLALKRIEPNTKYAPGNPLIEFERLPGIVLEGPVISENRKLDHSKVPRFITKGEQYTKERGPKHYNLDFNITLISKKHNDLIKMIVDLTNYFITEIDLLFPIQNPKYSCYMRFLNDFTTTSSNDISGICEAKAIIRIESVPMLSRVAVEGGSVIKNIDINIDEKGW